MQQLHKYTAGLVLAFFLGLSLPMSASADNFAPTQNFAGTDLNLNGKGIRTRLFFNLYTAGLYLQQPSNDATALLSGRFPMALRMEITSALITSETMETAVRDGFKLSAADKLPALQPRIDQLISIFKEKIEKGDVYDFIYRPQNVIVQKNGKNAGIIPGADFMQGLFGIWIGDKPAQADLKDKLLGK